MRRKILELSVDGVVRISFSVVNDSIQYDDVGKLASAECRGVVCGLQGSCWECSLADALFPLFRAFASIKSTDRVVLTVSQGGKTIRLEDAAQRIGFVTFSNAVAFSGCSCFLPLRSLVDGHDAVLGIDRLQNMLDLDALIKEMASHPDRQEPQPQTACFLDAAMARLEFVAGLARGLQGKDAAVGALSMLHSLLCLCRDNLARDEPAAT